MIQLDQAKVSKLGHSAEGLLTNVAFTEAFHSRVEQIIMDWLGTAPEGVEKREYYWRSLHELMELISVVEGYKEEAETMLSSDEEDLEETLASR